MERAGDFVPGLMMVKRWRRGAFVVVGGGGTARMGGGGYIARATAVVGEIGVIGVGGAVGAVIGGVDAGTGGAGANSVGFTVIPLPSVAAATLTLLIVPNSLSLAVWKLSIVIKLSVGPAVSAAATESPLVSALVSAPGRTVSIDERIPDEGGAPRMTVVL